MDENNPHTNEENETIESLGLEEQDYFSLGIINCSSYGEKATENEWDVIYRTFPPKNRWPQVDLGHLDEASERDGSYEVALVCEDGDDE